MKLILSKWEIQEWMKKHKKTGNNVMAIFEPTNEDEKEELSHLLGEFLRKISPLENQLFLGLEKEDFSFRSPDKLPYLYLGVRRK